MEGFGEIVLLMVMNVAGSPDDGEDWNWGVDAWLCLLLCLALLPRLLLKWR